MEQLREEPTGHHAVAPMTANLLQEAKTSGESKWVRMTTRTMGPVHGLEPVIVARCDEEIARTVAIGMIVDRCDVAIGRQCGEL